MYAARDGPGGFALLAGFTSDLARFPGAPVAAGGVQRARIRPSPHGPRLAALLGRPASLRIRRQAAPRSRPE